MTHVFISHSTKDDSFVTQLAADLQAKGVKTWVDHADIAAGADWDKSIENGINLCSILLFIVTPKSLESVVCGDEWNHALSLNKLVVPIMLGDGLSNDDLPFRLKRKQWVDFRGNYDQAMGKLLSALGLPQIETKPAESQGLNAKETDNLWSKFQGIVSRAVEKSQPTLQPPKLKLPMLEWCEISAGKVTIESEEFEVNPFWMTKYPVTVAQFERFIIGGGYSNNAYWTKTGWAWKEKNRVSQPRLWKNAKWHTHDHPTVGVSWYEAVAFCAWLNTLTPSSYGFRLPTEWEWQWAAVGDDGREYPWGNGFDKNKCNTKESGIGKTTPVNRYPNGVSPYDVYDMAGNTWEWCLNDGETPANIGLEGDAWRVMRGGAWNSDPQKSRSAYRQGDLPDPWEPYVGFRVMAPILTTDR